MSPQLGTDVPTPLTQRLVFVRRQVIDWPEPEAPKPKRKRPKVRVPDEAA